jgi:hypothetical protein
MLNPKFDRSQFIDPKHLDNVRKLPSILSHRTPCEAHHLRFAIERGVGLKATDRWVIPLTLDEHREIHTVGGKLEEEWLVERGLLNPYEIAVKLWANRGDLEAMRRVILNGH